MNTSGSPQSGGMTLSLEPSAFWLDLKAKNEAMIREAGLQNMKRTVSQNYFNWLITDSAHPFFRFVLKKWMRRPDLLPVRSKLSEMDGIRTYTNPEAASFSGAQIQAYRRYVSLVWSLMSRIDSLGLRFKVSEPLVGNPIPIMVGDKLISQDLATSIIETNQIAKLLKGRLRPRIAEVGAGYGRLAYVHAKTQPAQYFIFDIQPTLGVAEWYLQQTLGFDRVFKYRPFEKLSDVQGEIDRSSVILLSADQIKKFPDGYFDLCLSISTLPEMTLDQARFYLLEFQRLSSSHIFLKQWRHWKNPEDGTELLDEFYKFRAEWKLTSDTVDQIIPDFFNRVWSTTHDAAVV